MIPYYSHGASEGVACGQGPPLAFETWNLMLKFSPLLATLEKKLLATFWIPRQKFWTHLATPGKIHYWPPLEKNPFDAYKLNIYVSLVYYIIFFREDGLWLSRNVKKKHVLNICSYAVHHPKIFRYIARQQYCNATKHGSTQCTQCVTASNISCCGTLFLHEANKAENNSSPQLL